MKIENGKRVYDCSLYEYPFGIKKYIFNRIIQLQAHICGLIGLSMMFTGVYPSFIISLILITVVGYLAGCGVTMGCHRYWAHKSYKAKLPLQIILMIAQTMALQYPIFKWCRDHRIHHKYTETDADPHNARRGFYFAHIGWVIQKEHPMVKEKQETIDLSDLDNDPVVRFQSKYYWYLVALFHHTLPITFFHLIFPTATFFQLFCLNQTWYLLSVHYTSLVNSAAHLYGFQPYDNNIFARENKWVAALAMGEGWHNYHHVFPWDYKTAEIGLYKRNWACFFIDCFAKIGWAYDLKTVPEEIVKQRVKRTGDPQLHQKHRRRNYEGEEQEEKAKDIIEGEEVMTWGWGDPDASLELIQCTQTIRPAKMA